MASNTPAPANLARAVDAIKNASALLDVLADSTEAHEGNPYGQFLLVRLIQDRLNCAWDALQPRPDTEAP